MVSLLHLAQFSHLTFAFEECHSELFGVLGIPRNSILFMKSISSFDTSTIREAAIFKNCLPALFISPEVIIAEYDAILGY